MRSRKRRRFSPPDSRETCVHCASGGKQEPFEHLGGAQASVLCLDGAGLVPDVLEDPEILLVLHAFIVLREKTDADRIPDN